MAEVSLDTLEAVGFQGLSSVAGTKVAGYQRWVEVNGPRKTEFHWYQQAAANDFANEDSFKCGIARPTAAEVSFVNCDAAGPVTPSCTLEGVESEDTFRTVAIYDCDSINGAGILIKVHGF